MSDAVPQWGEWGPPMRVRIDHGLRVGFEPEAKAFDRAAEDAREFSRKARTLAGSGLVCDGCPGWFTTWVMVTGSV